MTIDDDERDRIKEEATRQASIENRLANLEGDFKMIKWAIGAAGATILSQIWEPLKAVIFHGN